MSSEAAEGKKTVNYPLIWAYIGSDDPHRGDSKASIGLSKLTADLLNGRSMYVDSEMIENHLKGAGFNTQLKAFMDANGTPDIVIGTASASIRVSLPDTTMIVDSMNEGLSKRFNVGIRYPDIVSHHLDKETLEKAGEEFDTKYPHIKGSLFAVMLGGDSYYEMKSEAADVLNVVRRYPEATIFLCPSRRSAGIVNRLQRALLDNLTGTTSKLRDAFAFRSPVASRITIMDVDYYSVKNGRIFNPYLGLLARADHLAVIGSSYSLVSEALFTGKVVYLDDRQYRSEHLYRRAKDEGFIANLRKATGREQVPKGIDPPNVTTDVAKALARRYEQRQQMSSSERQKDSQITKAPICLP